ncbi:hypothetical protein GPECTOR_4g579 [Gonium pectorale]|uniref:Uncharacterized protein n=1 Tax=Gonium pectorale TaxID=33097 RepID=A0A150GXH0_GONPE|nr:hypothetical protein GPECTOR_4g579 [Gonium pectorale]|eukprot:KXZ54514.1 hypothetical protein GPECTOR_4g579 [Gonium pectorale]
MSSLDPSRGRSRRLESLEKLKELRLSDNRLTSATPLQRLSELHTLALDGNLFTQIEGLQGLRSLKVLNLSYNQLSTVSSLGRLTSLEVLHVAGNQITDLEGLTGCPALRVLNACSNRLTHVKGLGRCASLSELHVADNKLTDLSGLKMVASSLEILDVSGNGLASLSGLCSLPKLTELFARENSIEGVEGLPARVPALELLDLASNRLSSSPAALAKALSPLTDLAALQLHGNDRLCAATSTSADGSATDYTAQLFAGLPSLELCDGRERPQTLALEQPGAGAGQGTGPAAAAAEDQPANGDGAQANDSGSGGGTAGGSLDPTIAEMEAFRKRLGIRTYAPQYAGRPGTSGSGGSRPGTAAGTRPGTAGGRPGTSGGRPGTGDFRETMVSYSANLKSVLSQMRANLKLPVYEAAQKLKAEGVAQLPQMPLAPEYTALPRTTGLALLAGEDRADVERREEALQMFERLFGSEGASGSGAGGSASAAATPPRTPLTPGAGPGAGAGASAAALAARNGVAKGGQGPSGRDEEEEEEDEVELRSSGLGGLPQIGVKAMRYKPQAKRIEVDLPLDTESRNYNDVIEDVKKIKQVTLRSTLAEDRTNLAVATIKGGKLLIAPLDFAVQMRPSMHHLNVASTGKEGKGNAESDDEEDDEPKLHAVEVQVQKRETERQAQARKNSYAYIAQKEEEEAFVNLSVHLEDSEAAARIWDKFMSAKEVDHTANKLGRRDYLRAIVPPPPAPPTFGGAHTDGTPAAAGTIGAASQLSEAARAALPGALRVLFQEHTVCSMGNVRTWLDSNPAAAAAKEAALLHDKELHQAVMAAGNVVSMHRVYVATKTGDEKTDPLRKLVVELLEAKESFKRSEFNDLARTNNMTFTETQYNKVVKDVCESRGNTWHIKNGASGL